LPDRNAVSADIADSAVSAAIADIADSETLGTPGTEERDGGCRKLKQKAAKETKKTSEFD
jgi:hypothetical protein